MKIIRAMAIAVIALCIAIPSGLALGRWEHQSVLEFDVDGFGNLYMLENDMAAGTYHLAKVDAQGNLIYRVPVSEPEEHSAWYFTNLRVTLLGEVILAGFRASYSESWAYHAWDTLVSEEVSLYSTLGAYQAPLLEIDWSTMPGPNAVPFVRSITSVAEDGLTILCSDGERYFEAAKLYFAAGHEPEGLCQFTLPEGLDVTTVTLSGTNELIITTPAGEIYNMLSQDEVYDITGLVGNRVIPMSPVPGAGDLITVYDMYTGTLTDIHLDTFTATDGQIALAGLAGDKGAGWDKDFNLSEVTAVRRLSNGNLGFQMVQMEGGPEFVSFGPDANMWSGYSHGGGYAFGMGLLVFAGAFSLLYLLLLGLLRLMKRWGLAQKMVFGFLPGYVVVMVALSLLLSGMVTQSFENELYDKMRIGMRMAAIWVDGDNMGQTDALKDYGSRGYNALVDSLHNAQAELDYVIDKMESFFIGYSYTEGRLFVTTSHYGYNYQPIENTVNADICAHYYSLMNQARLDGEAFAIFPVTDREGEWLVAIYPVLNSGGEPVGLMELSFDKSYYLDSVKEQTFLFILALFGISVVLVTAYFLISLKINLRPLKDLRWAVGQIGEGRMNARVNIKSRDEFRDIGIAFNIMSDKLEQYISNLVLLNSSYVKFVPSELFDLIGRENVTKVTLSDRATLDLSILYINFSGGSSLSQTMSQDDYFAVINKNFDKVSVTVENCRGVVVRFDGTGMLALFPVDVEDALVSAIQLKELLAGYGSKGRGPENDLHIVVSSGQALIGVAGNESRHTIATISDEVSEIYLMNNSAERLGIKYLVTEKVLRGLLGDTEYHYRYIGRYYNINRDTVTEIYEFLDGEDVYSRNLKLQTRKIFEEGVALFKEGNFFEARKRFVDVLRINSGDALASSYLMLCDRFEVTRPEHWMGVLFSI